MDALSDILRATRLTAGVFLHAEFTEPWCVRSRVTPENCAPFMDGSADIIPYHYVIEGRLRAKADGGLAVELAPGEAVLFPRNDWHLLGGDLDMRPVLGEEIVQPSSNGLHAIRHGGGGARTRVVCGFLGAERLSANPVISALPAMLHVRMEEAGAAAWMRSTFSYAADEIAAARMGSQTVLAKLSELLLVEAIRRYVETLPEQQSGWLAGLKDPYVSRALALLHARVADPWTVDHLGCEIGLSRSALAERFHQVMGLAPMQYLTQWRMQLAGQEIANSRKSVARVSAEVGYESEAAFSRAFKRVMGMAPGEWRRRANAR